MRSSASRHPPYVVLGWAIVGAALALSVSQLAIITVPLAAVLIGFLARRSNGPELVGAVVGAGAVGVLIGVINLDYRPCPSNGVLVLPVAAREASCGGFDGLPWLIAGASVMLAGVLLYGILNLRSIHRRST